MNVWKDSPEMNGTDLLGKRCTELYSISATPTQFRVLNNPNNYSACTMQLPATHYFNYSKGYENTNLVCHYTSALGTTKGSLKSLWKACPLDFKEKRIQRDYFIFIWRLWNISSVLHLNFPPERRKLREVNVRSKNERPKYCQFNRFIRKQRTKGFFTFLVE